MPSRAALARASLAAVAVATIAGSPALALPAPPAIPTVTSPLSAVGGSGEGGTIGVGPARDFGTIVHVRLAHQPPGVLQPAEIRAGTCAKYDADPHYALEPVLSGRSDTRIDVARKQLLAEGGVVIVHLSRTRDDVVACGPVG